MVTATPSGAITGIGIGGSYGKSNRKYTDTPTSLLADEDVSVTVGRTTYLLGAVLASKTNKLKLDTANFIFDNYSDKDVSGSIGVNLNIGVNPGSWDGTGSLAYRDQRAITYATLGLGDISIRNRPNQDLSGLNRDLANVQRVTRDIDFDVHIPGLNLKTLAEDLEAAGNFLRAASAEVPAHIKLRGAQAVDIYRDLLVLGASAGQIASYIASGNFEKDVKARTAWENAVALYGPNSEQAQRIAFLITQGEQVFVDQESGEFYVRTHCANTAGPTPCDILVDENVLPSLSKDDVLNLVWSSADRLVSGGITQEQYRLAWQCALSWSIENLDDSLFADLEQRMGGEALAAGVYSAGLDLMKVEFARAAIRAAKSGDKSELQQYRANAKAYLDSLPWYKADTSVASLNFAGWLLSEHLDDLDLTSLENLPALLRWDGGASYVEDPALRALAMINTNAVLSNTEYNALMWHAYAAGEASLYVAGEGIGIVAFKIVSVGGKLALKPIGNLLGGKTFGKLKGTKLSKISPEDANAGFGKPPYNPEKPIVDFVADGKTTYVRVYTEGSTSQGGRWMMRADDIEGLTPKQIQSKFDLPEIPTHVTNVKPPQGTAIRTGTVKNGNFGGKGGGTQFEIRQRVSEDSFFHPRPL